MDRRAFLGACVGAALGLGACRRSSEGSAPPLGPDSAPYTPPSPVALLGPDQLPPSPRITLRLPGRDEGVPNPYLYLPTGYGAVVRIYDTLLERLPGGGVLPWLATSHSVSDDAMTHRFELRDGVRWHDGRPFSAEDVVFSFEYFAAKWAEVKISRLVLFRPDNVVRVVARGPRRVEVVLDKPVVTFVPNVAGRFPIVPKHTWSSVDSPAAVRDPSQLVGTGPYRLTSYADGKYLFEANDDFFLGRPFVRRIEHLPVGDELNALKAGDIDLAAYSAKPASATILKSFDNDPSMGVTLGRLASATSLYWNLASPGPAADVAFRRACALALDRGDFVRRLLGGLGTPGNPGYLPPDHPFHAPVEQYPHSPAAADRLLEESGYRRSGSKGARLGHDGKPLRLRIAVDPSLEAPVQLVKQGLGAVGIELTIDPVGQGFSYGPTGDMGLLFTAALQEDPDIMRVIYSSRADKLFFSAWGYANPEFDDLADRQLVTADEAERRRLVARMQEIVATDLPLLHLYYPTQFLVYKRDVFDQWPAGGANKLTLVTGVGTGDARIRPTT